ncbi:MAG: radical SAM protein [Dysgonamonadaceae bacterium]|jgi:molybdenum cofactor biosynthesis enzyme MoaA|nr:radical SAM protein [Dysgonamonadaceae bacterium]
MNNKEIHLRRLNFWINNRCTLRCRLCGSGIPYFRESERYDMTVNDFKRTIRSVLGYGEEAGIIDSADSIEINGGEPLLNSSLPLILEEILKYKSHFTKVRINTNGTIVPNKKLLDVLIKYNDMDTGYGLGGGGWLFI